jgi:Rho termination factor, N-terminal domain
MANETPDTPGLSESELRATSQGELREQAQAAGIEGAESMKKPELIEALSAAARDGRPAGGDADGGGGEAGLPGDRGPDEGHLRTGEETSRSLKYSQEITSLDEEPEREGRSLATTSHEVIRQWAEERSGVPATVEGTEHGDHLGVLRFDFGGDNERLRQVSWDEWFETFDARELNFIYQEERKDGRQSTFFRLESPHREDA